MSHPAERGLEVAEDALGRILRDRVGGRGAKPFAQRVFVEVAAHGLGERSGVARSDEQSIDAVADGVSGVLVPPEDPVALADALVGVLSDAELQLRLAEGARAGAVPWLQTPEQYADRVRELVTRVAAEQ